jgi:fluoride exporter
MAKMWRGPCEWRATLVVIAAGGVLGAEARHGVSLLLGQSSPQFPWPTLVVNASGCALIGVLMTATAATTGNLGTRRLIRPFLGVGVLGG